MARPLLFAIHLLGTPIFVVMLDASKFVSESSHLRNDVTCAITELVGHSWTYISPSAFKGGAWSREHECIYQFKKASDGASDIEFESPPQCIVRGDLAPPFSLAAPALVNLSRNSVNFRFLVMPSNKTILVEGWMAAGCSLIDTTTGGMYVRGYANGRSHPMDFAAHEYLRVATAWVIRSAMVTFTDGSKQLTPGIPIAPGAKPHYDGYWMRDGFYGSSNGLNLVNSSMRMSFMRSYEWMFARAREDGILPQACPFDIRRPCSYGQGAGSLKSHDNQDLDTCSFAVKSLYVFFTLLPSSEAKSLFMRYKDLMLRSMRATTKDPDGSGCLWSNTSNPQVGYGFQDAETKSGAVLYSSLLYWNATRLMAEMANATGDQTLCAELTQEAEKLRASVTRKLWNETLGVFMASTGLESLNVDIWGNAMAGAMGFTTEEQDAKIFAYFRSNEENIFFEGQVREIPFPTQWTDRSIVSPSPLHPSDPMATIRSYQNGGYWATPHHHVLPWLALHDKPMACRLLNATIASFRSHGIWEWIGPFFPAPSFGAPGYTASAANTYFASEQLRCWETVTEDTVTLV